MGGEVVPKVGCVGSKERALHEARAPICEDSHALCFQQGWRKNYIYCLPEFVSVCENENAVKKIVQKRALR